MSLLAPDALLSRRPYKVPRREKEAELLWRLTELTEHHRAACPAYGAVLDRLWKDTPTPAARLQDIPWVPVQLLESRELRAFLDRENSALHTRALASTMEALLGAQPRPTLILDARDAVGDPGGAAGRAGSLGMSAFGRDHLYAFDADMRLRRQELRGWLRAHAGEPLFLFGVTSMVWRQFLDALIPGEVDLRDAILLHGGGWEQLQSEGVGPREFRDRLAETTGLSRAASYWSPAEQIGTVLIECERGRLHAPNFADILVRDPDTWELQPTGTAGVIQVLSSLPTSYPGHSLLTGDLGTVVTRDGCGCGWLGAAIELHGPSDTHAPIRAAAACAPVRAIRHAVSRNSE